MEEYLYHYTTVETLLFYILPQKTLRFSDIRKTNDPEEIYDHGFQLCEDVEPGPDVYGEYIREFEINQKKFADILRKEAKIRCCSQDSPPGRLEILRNNGRGYLRPRMWE